MPLSTNVINQANRLSVTLWKSITFVFPEYSAPAFWIISSKHVSMGQPLQYQCSIEGFCSTFTMQTGYNVVAQRYLLLKNPLQNLNAQSTLNRIN